MSITEKYKLKLKPVDAVFVTEDNYREVAEWCGGTVIDDASCVGNHIAPCIMVPTIGTSGTKMNLVPTRAVAGKHAIFQDRLGYFVVLTVDRFEELWEPAEDLQGMCKQPDEAEKIAFGNDRICPMVRLSTN